MRIVVDQTLGLPVPIKLNAVVRKLTLKKKVKLEIVIEKGSNNVYKRNLPTIKRTMEEEIEQIGRLLKKNKHLLYIFDGQITDEAILKRIRNWYLPEYTLQIVDGSVHRAYAFYLLKLVEEGQSLSTSLPAPNGYIISNVKRVTMSNYKKIGRKPKGNYFLISGEQLENKKREEHTVLLEKLLNKYPERKFIAVGNMDNLLMTNLEYYPLGIYAAPNSINYLSIFPLPERSDGN